MNVTKLQSLPADRKKFVMVGTTPFVTTGIDAALQRLDAIYSLSAVMSRAYLDSRVLGEKSELDSINPELVGGAWDGIGLLAAEAAFAIHESI